MSLPKEDLSAAAIRKTWLAAVKHHLMDSTTDQFDLNLAGDYVSRETAPGLEPRPLDEALFAVSPSKEFFEILEYYARLVFEGNKLLNLVSRKNPGKQILANILESLPLAYAWLQVSRETKSCEPLTFLMDVGSGSGVPGIPAWILIDHLAESEAPQDLLLVESRGRKAEFLEGVVDEMSMDCAKVFAHRLESPDFPLVLDVNEIQGPGMLCSRALSSVDQTLKWSKGLKDRVREMIFIKGTKGLSQEWREERSRWPKRGWRTCATHAFDFVDRRTLLLHIRQG